MKKEKLIKSQRTIDKFVGENVSSYKNLNESNENLNCKNHVSEAKSNEVNIFSPKKHYIF